MTYSEVMYRAFALGMNCADVALGSMMDIVEEETGCFPKWDSEAPKWILDNFGIEEGD